MNPQKSHAEIPEPWKFSKNILNFRCCMYNTNRWLGSAGADRNP